MLRNFICVLCQILLLGVSSSAYGNDAPVILGAGGAQLMSGPITVVMESEIVQITLKENSYIVDATFNFRNTGEKWEIDVGFPKNGRGSIDDRFSGTVDFIKFETWVDGAPVKAVEQPGMARIQGNYTLPELIKKIRETEDAKSLRLYAVDNRWMVKTKVMFPANKSTVTRVLYEAPYNPAGLCIGSMGYTYGTGQYWAGNIGKSTFIIDSSAFPKEDRPKDIYISDSQDRKKAKITRPKDGIIKCEIQNYKPHTSDAWIGMSLGCPWDKQ